MRRFLAGLAVSCASFLVALLALEIGLRAATGSLTEWRNYATDPGNLVKVTAAIEFDPQLGWVLKKNNRDFGQGPWGNRLHKAAAGASGAPILAVGDSFTYGSEVGADETWPAQLEQKMQVPIVNAGVGGYGIDQAVLLAERIAPQIKPRMIVLAFIVSDITRAKTSIFSGATKPFYRVVDGKLQAQNLPLEPYAPTLAYNGVKAVLGYSKLIDWTAQRLGYGDDWRAANFQFKYEEADEVATACAFMDRLAKIGPPAVVVGEHGWSDFTPGGKTGVDQLNAVLDCAERAGMMTVRTWEPFRAALPSEPGEAFKKYYVNGTGHMTAFANGIVAGEIAKALAEHRETFAGKTP